MAQLKLIRASAGSGKTFSLTRIFLEMVLVEPTDYYRRILAVTFTNKATAEMKSRILEELYKLASNQKSDHLEHLTEFTPFNEAKIRNKSQAILNFILHGYSWFRIETIDTFFQGVIRSFVRELNIPGNYSIELDQEKVLDEAINRLLDKLDNKNKLVDWLLQYIDTKISEGKSWVIKNELQKLGKSLFKEEVIENLPKLEPLINESDFLKTYRSALIEIVREYEKKISETAANVLNQISSIGLEDKEFFYKGAGTISYFRNLENKKFELPGKRILSLLDNPDKWASKETNRTPEIQKLGGTVLNPAILKITEIINTESKDYNTASAILKNLHILGLLTHLHAELKNLQREKGIMLISDASPFIQNIINNNDTPFIYEKAGNQINHLLIDEFQDTSSMQWGNFKPLISNSLSNNKDCLLVGDIKQSIYRWRNSNWEILASKVKEELTKNMIKEDPLTTNWRSNARIVQFNNEFFSRASVNFQQLITGNNSDNILIQELYCDVSQGIPEYKEKNKGYINFRLFDKKEIQEDTEYYGSELINRINEVLSKGYEPGQIAMLIRNKKEGTSLANFIVNANKEEKFSSQIGVISNESLFLEGSPAVNLLIAAMYFVYKPGDKLIASGLLNSHKQVFDNENTLYIKLHGDTFGIEELNREISPDFTDKCKALRMENLHSIAVKLSALLNLHTVDNEKVYLHSFLDIVFLYGTSELSDLGGFLEYWEDEGHKKTISAAETHDSIRILTIHKSKGLEFPIVFVPFCNWSFTPMPGEQQWLTMEESPYNKLPLIPVNLEGKLAESHFAHQYHAENFKTLIDNLNLLYVAFTRAESALIGFIADSKDLKNTGDVVIKTLEELTSGNQLSGMIFTPEEQRFRYGEMPECTTLPDTSETMLMWAGTPPTQLPEVKISSQAQQFMKDPLNPDSDAATKGRIMHSIMERVNIPEDIHDAVRCMTLQGIIDLSEGEEINNKLTEALKNPTVAKWFSETATVLTETEIIGVTGQINRPDRVVIDNDKLTIIDYKFGAETDKEEHIKQLAKYKFLVKNMGYKKVQGFIWYVTETDIIEV